MTRLLLSCLAAAATAVCTSTAQGAPQADQLGINVYGLSYHFDRDRARELDVDNELNPGLGLRYHFAEWKRWSFYGEAGVFRDSGRNAAKVLGTAALWDAGAGIHAGAAVAVFHSDTYNSGDVFVAPIPLLAYDAGPVTFNLTYFPKISRFNDVATLGFWLTIWPGRW